MLDSVTCGLLLKNSKDIVCQSFFSHCCCKGKSNKEIEEELLKIREQAMEGHSKSEELLIDLEKRYRQDKEMISSKLKGVNTNTMATEEKLTEYALMIREQLRAREEAKFDSAAVSVGIAERLKAQVQRCGNIS